MPRRGESARSETGPSQEPPGAAAASSGDVGQSRPEELTAAQQAQSATAGGAGVAPTLEPPSAAAVGSVGAWQGNKKITALWSINQNRNSWVAVDGVGWKKLANNSDSAVVALTILGANAKLTQHAVNYRDEADGMIHEMYVW